MLPTLASRDAVNYFEPYERRPAGHEDQLTRALLVVLKLSPMAHAAWLRQVDGELDLSMLPRPSFTTQVRAVRPNPGEAGDAEGPRVVSVFLGPRVADTRGVVQESDRTQVLDANISYEDELVVIVENKVTEADDWQSLNINLGGRPVRLDSNRITVAWEDLLEDFMRLLERQLVAGAEAGVLDDFMAYVETHFGSLGPSRTLELARGNRYRQDRRLRALLTELTGVQADLSHAPGIPLSQADRVKHLYLHMADDGQTVVLELYPGDTLGQARALYRDTAALDRLLSLREKGWSLEPNFHFGHMQRGFAWTPSDLDVEAYVRFWQREIDTCRQIPREGWAGYLAWLREQRVVPGGYRDVFDRDFTGTARQDASPRPGLVLWRPWALTEAERLDADRRFLDAIRASIDEACEAIGVASPVAGR